MCTAYWLPDADRRFVPQALALDAASVWVGGYRWSERYDARVCGVVWLERRTGRPIARQRLVAGAVGARDQRFCRHGGGLALTDEGLWVLETRRLWLLDPALVGTGTDPVLRAWLLLEPLRGSVLVEGGGRLGIGAFGRERRTAVHWFDVEDLLAPGVLDLATRATTATQVSATRRSPAPSLLQGGDVGPGGIEGIELDGDDLWAVSEAGAKPYQLRGGRPMVPMVLRLDAEAVLTGPRPACTP